MKKLFIAFMIIGYSWVAGANQNSEILKRTEAGNLRALNQAFRLLAKADGAVAEDISVSIGKSIQKNPKNFLLVLKKNKAQTQRLDSILGNLGDEYVDEMTKQKVELEARLVAIQSVKASSLKTVRRDCETVLARLIDQHSRIQ